MIITRTPMRISFFGGGTDYPVYFREFGGAVLSTAIDKSCYITCRHLPPFFEYHSRVSYSRIENVDHNSEFKHPSVRACLEYLGVEQGVEIHHVADLPARTGLGTSSAFTVGLLLGLYALREQMRNKHALATDAIHVEQEVIGEAVGSQDQVSAGSEADCGQARKVGRAGAALRTIFYRVFQNCVGNCQRADTIDSAPQAGIGDDVRDGQ
jgi:D-glycero-alpha-D-manno-heptose-7-phosphate kinase